MTRAAPNSTVSPVSRRLPWVIPCLAATIIVLFLIVASVLGWWHYTAVRQREAVETLKRKKVYILMELPLDDRPLSWPSPDHYYPIIEVVAMGHKDSDPKPDD